MSAVGQGFVYSGDNLLNLGMSSAALHLFMNRRCILQPGLVHWYLVPELSGKNNVMFLSLIITITA